MTTSPAHCLVSWDIEPGETYHIEVAEHGISYDVHIVDCGG